MRVCCHGNEHYCTTEVSITSCSLPVQKEVHISPPYLTTAEQGTVGVDTVCISPELLLDEEAAVAIVLGNLAHIALETGTAQN